MNNTTLDIETRSCTGTGPARALRNAGKVPAVIYSKALSPMHIAVSEKEITGLYRKSCFTSTVIELNLDGKKFLVLPKEAQLHPITDLVRHVDFIALDQEKVNVDVPIVFEGRDRSIGIKRGGFFNIIKRKIKLSCPSNNVPKNVSIDISAVPVGSSIKMSQLTLPEGCCNLHKSDLIIASMIGKAGKAEQEEGAAAAAK